MPTGDDIYLPTKDEIDRLKKTIREEHLEAKKSEDHRSYDRGVSRMIDKASGYKDTSTYISFYDW